MPFVRRRKGEGHGGDGAGPRRFPGCSRAPWREGGGPSTGRLSSIAKAGNEGYMLPEQVWDENPYSGQARFLKGEGTFSATPLAWTHAQYVRLAWSVQAGSPVEQPSIAARRYTGRCPD